MGYFRKWWGMAIYEYVIMEAIGNDVVEESTCKTQVLLMEKVPH